MVATAWCDAQNTNFAPDATGPTTEPTVEWRYRHEEPLLGPVVDDEVVVVDEPERLSTVRALKSADGSTAWEADERTVRRRPALTENTVVLPVGGSGDELRGIDRTDGTERWHIDLPSDSGTAATITSERAYVGAGREIVAVSVETGEIEWQYDATDAVGETATDEETDRSFSRPAVDDTTVYTVPFSPPSEAHPTVHAIDLADGEGQWAESVDVPEDWSLTNSIVAGVDSIFLSAHYRAATATGEPPPEKDSPGRLIALDANSGSTAWDLELEERPFWAPALADEVLFLVTHNLDGDDTLHAIDAEHGCVYWSQSLDVDNPFTPVVTSESIYYASGRTIVARDIADGSRRWTYDVPDVDPFNAWQVGPIVADETLYLRTQGAEGELSELVALR